MEIKALRQWKLKENASGQYNEVEMWYKNDEDMTFWDQRRQVS